MSVNSGILDLDRVSQRPPVKLPRVSGRYQCSRRTDRWSCSLIPAIAAFFSLALTVLLLRRIFGRKRPNNLPLHCELWEVACWPIGIPRRPQAEDFGPETISLLSML